MSAVARAVEQVLFGDEQQSSSACPQPVMVVQLLDRKGQKGCKDFRMMVAMGSVASIPLPKPHRLSFPGQWPSMLRISLYLFMFLKE